MAQTTPNKSPHCASNARNTTTRCKRKISKQDYAEAARLRDEAAQRGDADAWHNYDRDCETLENDWARYFAPAPQQPQVDPRLTAYANRKKVFLDRHGMAAVQAMDMAHAYATRPETLTLTTPVPLAWGYRRVARLLQSYRRFA